MTNSQAHGAKYYITRISVLVLAIAIMGICMMPAQGSLSAFASEEQAAEGSGTIIVIPAPDTPTTDIVPEETPLAAPEVFIPPVLPPLATYATWALLNLILTVFTCLVMASLLVIYFSKRKEDGEEGQARSVNRHLWMRIVTIGTTAAAIVLFIITQNIPLPMAWADQYTVWHIFIFIATGVLAIFAGRKYEATARHCEEA